jgi:hypothetical protein
MSKTGAKVRATRVTSVLAVAAIGTMALAACSSGSKSGAGATGSSNTSTQTAAQAVSAALHNLGRQSSLSVTISLPITQAQANQLNQMNTSGSKLTPAEMHALTTGSIFLDVATGSGEPLNSQKAQTDSKNSIDFGLTVNGNTPVEIRYVNQNLYLHLRISQLLTDVGQKPGSAGQFTQALGMADQYVPGLAALGRGDWVELTHQSIVGLEPTLKQLGQKAQQSSGNTSASTASPQQTRNAVLKLVGDLTNDLKANTTFVDLGNSNGRTHYSGTVNVSAVANAAIPILQNDLKAIPAFGSSASNSLGHAQSSIKPGMRATADLYVSSNKLSEVDVNVAQFAKNRPDFQVPLRFAFGSPGSISAPSGATQLQTSKLPAMLGALAGGSSSA